VLGPDSQGPHSHHTETPFPFCGDSQSFQNGSYPKAHVHFHPLRLPLEKLDIRTTRELSQWHSLASCQPFWAPANSVRHLRTHLQLCLERVHV
jgi:hypothetical protein